MQLDHVETLPPPWVARATLESAPPSTWQPTWTDAVNSGLAAVDRRGELVYANQAFIACLGDEAPPASQAWVSGLAQLARADGAVTRVKIDGDRRVRFSATALADGTVVVAATDLGELTRVMNARTRAERDFEATFTRSPIGVALVSLSGRLLRTNVAWTELTGYKSGEIRDLRAMSHAIDVENDLDMFDDLLRRRRNFARSDRRFVHADGSDVWVDLNVSLVIDPFGEPLHFVVQALDISDRKRVEAELAAERAMLLHSATHDTLTGVGNRTLLQDRLGQILAQRYDPAKTVGVLFADLNGFKPINDRFGHAAGDQVLVMVAERLVNACRQGDLVTRIGGDEFVIVATSLRNGDEADGLARRLERVISEPMTVADGHTISISASLGIALREPADTLEGLLHRADSAAYDAKRARRAAELASAELASADTARPAAASAVEPAAVTAAERAAANSAEPAHQQHDQ